MDFRLSDEQQLFRKTLRQFVDNEIRPVAREWEHSGRYPTEIVDAMKRMGLFGMTVPEEYGGMNVDFVLLALVFEERRHDDNVDLARFQRCRSGDRVGFDYVTAQRAKIFIGPLGKCCRNFDAVGDNGAVFDLKSCVNLMQQIAARATDI